MAEVRRLFWRLALAIHQSTAFVLGWSHWRRRHQAIARYYHYRRRDALDHLQL